MGVLQLISKVRRQPALCIPLGLYAREERLSLIYLVFLFVFSFGWIWFFETRPLYEAGTGLDLVIWTRLASGALGLQVCTP